MYLNTIDQSSKSDARNSAKSNRLYARSAPISWRPASIIGAGEAIVSLTSAASLLHQARDGVVAGPFQLLLLDLLLDEVLRVADRGLRAGDGDDPVAGAGREGALLGDLDVGAGHLLDLDQAPAAGPCKWHGANVVSRLIPLLEKVANELLSSTNAVAWKSFKSICQRGSTYSS